MTKAKNVQINVVEIANPNLDARLVARWIADQLEGRRSFRATQKKAIQNTMRAGAKGIKTAVSGRLGGADMARTEGYSEGVVPLHTLRSDIDYAWEEAVVTIVVEKTLTRTTVKVETLKPVKLNKQLLQVKEVTNNVNA